MELSAYRQELSLYPGPSLSDGQPSYTLHDPARNLFFQLDWTTFEILKRWQLGDTQAIVSSIITETTLHIDVDNVEAVLKFLEEHQLLHVPPGQTAKLGARARQHETGLGKWLLHNYLFFRIPLLLPDRWLGQWSGRIRWLFTPQFWWLTIGVLGVGLVEVYRDWDRFSTTLVDSFTLQGAVSYVLALVFVKTLHELGHAFTAKRFGCKVPTMGVAFLVMFPMAYTDTNDVWKLTSRRQRLQVASAGILTELTIAAWATLLWSLLPDGPLRSVTFLLSTTTWVSTVAINASPFMRFDGYFLLSDWLEMPNLHARAFALARWDMRERFFALGDAVPEVLPGRRHAGLILFAYFTWIYRLVIFLGIAALVYAFFIKAVGILLFLVEIIWFILLPPYRELKFWRLRWPELRASRRAKWTALIGCLALLLFVVPWPNRIAAMGLLRPIEQFVVYAPSRAQLETLPVADGQVVKAGDLLIQLTSNELESRRRAAQARRDRSNWQASAGAFDVEQRAQWQVSHEQTITAQAELANIAADAERYAPLAPFAGVLRDIDPDLRPGNWLGSSDALARLVATHEHQVIAYLDEDDVTQIARGNPARFYAEGLEGPFLPLEVIQINTDVSRSLPEIELSQMYGGSLLVREKKGVLYPEQAIYRVTFKVLAPLASLQGHSWRGKVVVSGDWVSPGARFSRTALSVFWREAGF
jgi:putative peptide zinc metalloprotease protein